MSYVARPVWCDVLVMNLAAQRKLERPRCDPRALLSLEGLRPMLMWLPSSSELEVTTGRIEAAYCDGKGGGPTKLSTISTGNRKAIQTPLPPAGRLKFVIHISGR